MPIAIPAYLPLLRSAWGPLVLDTPPLKVEELPESRRRLVLGGYDEAWEGTCHVAPLAGQRHGRLQSHLDRILGSCADRADLIGTGPLNPVDSYEDFRVPDLACHCDETAASRAPAVDGNGRDR